ncbi:MAG: glycine cleavage system aminomethyltransferase GcvT [Pseudomonadota bacterium]
MTELRRTPMYERHKALGAKIVPFAGWEMPVEYTGILDEHETVRTKAGIFDVSHMGEIEIRGKRALEFCQRIATNDASILKPGKIQYSTILNERGGMIDDCTLYRLSDDGFLFVVNASRKDRVLEWFKAHAIDHATITDKSDEFALIALQGKSAQGILNRLVRRNLDTVGYYEFVWTELVGTAALVSRTGYTGEDGFEMYLAWEKGGDAWDAIVREGSREGLKAIGLGARDTLRLEMGYLLYGNDMNEDVTPLEAGVSWIVKLEKGNFLGRDALIKMKEAGVPRRIRGLKMKGRAIPRQHYEIRSGGRAVGEVTSGTYSPTLKQGIALGFVQSGLETEAQLDVIVRTREEPAVVVKPPFVAGSVRK